GRCQDLAELVLHAGTLDALHQRALHAFFHAGISVHYIPALAAGAGRHRRTLVSIVLDIVTHYFFQPRITSYNKNSSNLSVPHRKIAMMSTKPKTMAVICIASLRAGQTTFFVSRTASLANMMKS